MPSEHFARFYASCFENTFHAVHDGLDYDALQQFSEAERQEIIAELLQALGTPRDTHSRPVMALGYLRAAEAAGALEERLRTSSGYDRVETAVALYRIAQYPRAAQIVLDVLAHTPISDEWTRMRAVEALGNFPRSEAVVCALYAALRADGTVRYQAAIALKRLYADSPHLVFLLNEIQLAGVGLSIEPERDARRNELCAEAWMVINSSGRF